MGLQGVHGQHGQQRHVQTMAPCLRGYHVAHGPWVALNGFFHDGLITPAQNALPSLLRKCSQEGRLSCWTYPNRTPHT
jgi:hypothetical protein